MTRVALVAPVLGQGGGHLSRALALRRGVDRAGAPIDLRVFGPADERMQRWLPDVQEADWSDRRLLDPETCLQAPAAQALTAWKPDVVLVDLVWLPVQALLQATGLPAWLLLRHVPPTWLQGPPRRPFQRACFDRIVCMEPWQGPRPEGAREVDPVVTTLPDELHPAAALRAQLGVPTGRPLALIAQTGHAAELDTLRGLAPPDHTVVPLSLHHSEALVPLAPWLAGADHILGGAGYNLFWEVRVLGLTDRARLVAFGRNNDDQAWRLRALADHRPRSNGADTLVRWLAAG
jgi:hypothetical protein